MYSLFARLSEISQEASQRCKASGILTSLLDDLHSSDSLVKLNAVELCSELMIKTGNSTLLNELGVFDLLSQFLKVDSSKLDVVDSMCACKTVTLFCELSRLRDIDFPAFSRAHNLLPSIRKVCLFVFSLFRSNDTAQCAPSLTLLLHSSQMMYSHECRDLQEAAILGVGIIGSTHTGLGLLDSENVVPSDQKFKKPVSFCVCLFVCSSGKRKTLSPGGSLVSDSLSFFSCSRGACWSQTLVSSSFWWTSSPRTPTRLRT